MCNAKHYCWSACQLLGKVMILGGQLTDNCMMAAQPHTCISASTTTSHVGCNYRRVSEIRVYVHVAPSHHLILTQKIQQRAGKDFRSLVMTETSSVGTIAEGTSKAWPS